MAGATSIKSLRVTLISLIVGLVVTVVALSSYFTANLFLDTASEQLLRNTLQWSSVISERSVEDIRTNDHASLDSKLNSLKTSPYIHYVHIYKISSISNEVKFFTSYNRDQTLPPIQDKIKDIAYLSIPRISDDYIEYVTPIEYKSGIIGYVYIKTSSENIQALRNNIIAVVLVMLFIIVLASFAFAYKLSEMIDNASQTLVSFIEKVIKEKNYSAQCPPLQFQELDILSHEFNLLMKRTEKHIKNLEHEKDLARATNLELEEKVSARTDALKESNQELLSTLEKLHQFQGQLVENEKMASLGDMVAGVAHEVNTPIGLGVTASTLLADKLAEIKTAFENKSLRSSQLKRFLDDGQENVDIVFRNLNRAANLISSFKKVSVNQSTDDISAFNVEELLNEVMLTLAPQIKNTAYHIHINCPSDLTINSKAGPLNQILINLIFNSIIHGFEGKGEGEITINVMILGSQLHIQYQDNGVGMAEEFKVKAFDPFTTTKRGSGGSGLGLHLVYNLVTQALGGTIALESELGHGVIFDINFPINPTSKEQAQAPTESE